MGESSSNRRLLGGTSIGTSVADDTLSAFGADADRGPTQSVLRLQRVRVSRIHHFARPMHFKD